MKKLFLIVGAWGCLSSSLFAVLPPLYQGLNELKAIIEDRQIGELLQSGEVITDIHKTAEGYVIVTNHHHLVVQVVIDPSVRPGPALFHLVFQKPVSLDAPLENRIENKK